MIGVLDYGVGNIGSITNMLSRIGAEAKLLKTCDDFDDVERLILPGVGSFDDAMTKFNQSGLRPIFEQRVLEQKVPVLGICLGAQMMTKRSDEGRMPGLGWFDAVSKKFDFSCLNRELPLPNIGWRHVQSSSNSKLLSNFDREPKFYFAHSYFLVPLDDDSLISMTTKYGIEYACGLSNGNIHCVQFHPEKSNKYGMQLLCNFLEFF